MGKGEHSKLPFIQNLQKYKQHSAFILVLIFAALQFILILRHKSPFLSDSYMYLHQFYQFKGDNFHSAYQKVTSQVDLQKSDEIEKNIFTNENAYKNSYAFFSKRPLYPQVASKIDLFVKNQYISMIIPPFAAYLALLTVVYLLARNSQSSLFATSTVMLLAAFYPYLDYSTYFLTDTIGAFFWFVLLLFVYKFITTSDKKWALLYVEVFILALLNREQPVLFMAVLTTSHMLIPKSGQSGAIKKNIRYLVGLTLMLSVFYFAVSQAFGARTLKDTITYTQNRYGLKSGTYSNYQTLKYLAGSAIGSHYAAAVDLYQHHLWFFTSAVAVLGVAKMFFSKTKRKVVDVLMLSSALASYLFVYIFPDFSWRYYYPLIIGIIYFATTKTQEHFGVQK